MSNLVFCSKDNTPLTTTKIIAESLDKRHTDVLELTKHYQTDLRQFGPVPFKTEQVKRGSGARDQKAQFAYLNEPQATLLISMMRNSEKVIRFKVALVKAFYEMKKKLAEQSLTYTPDQITEIKNKAIKQGYAVAKSDSKDDLKISKEQLKSAFYIFEQEHLSQEKNDYEAILRVTSFLLKNRERFQREYEELKNVMFTLKEIATSLSMLEDALPVSTKIAHDFASRKIKLADYLQEHEPK